jgi:hypothetical protein
MNVAIKADLLVNGDRAAAYGSPEVLYNRIADLWAAYLGDITITPQDVINMHILMKVARTHPEYHEDSYVDIAGYALVAEKLNLEQSWPAESEELDE